MPVSIPMDIRPVNRTAFLSILTVIAASCSENPATDFTAEQMNIITTGAGMLARNLAFLPDSAGWSEAPGRELTEQLELMSETNTEVWPVFFRAAADTAMKLDQLEQQAQQEAIQAEML